MEIGIREVRFPYFCPPLFTHMTTSHEQQQFYSSPVSPSFVLVFPTFPHIKQTLVILLVLTGGKYYKGSSAGINHNIEALFGLFSLHLDI